MTSVFKKAIDLLVGSEAVTVPSPRIVLPKSFNVGLPLKRMSERELIQLESEIGAEIFGQVPEGHRREFFNLDPSTWIWYDEWTEVSADKRSKQHKSVTIRYEVHENGVLKVLEGSRYDFIEGVELQNFVTAVGIYYERVCREVYKTHPKHTPHHRTNAISAV